MVWKVLTDVVICQSLRSALTDDVIQKMTRNMTGDVIEKMTRNTNVVTVREA
jgi:hypothetical protein